MAKSCTVILLGGPKGGEWHHTSMVNNRLSCCLPPPMHIRSYDPTDVLEPLQVIDYDILPGGYAPHPGDPSKVFRLGLLRGLDPAVELLKILLERKPKHG